MPPLWLALSLCRSEPGPVFAADPAPWLGDWALRFTPKVARGPGVWLLEVSSTLRLWGGLPALLVQMQAAWPKGVPGSPVAPDAPGTMATLPMWRLATGPTALAAVARWRMGECLPGVVAQPGLQHLLNLPLHTLDAARPYLPVLGRLGVHNWGQLRRLPRAGVARRWGHGLLQALDQALGDAPEAHTWLQPTPGFDMALEWPHHLESAQALMAPAQQLLAGLHGWLMHRQLGVLAWRWTWAHDPRRNVATHGGFDLHVAQPSQNLVHLTRLTAEHLARHPLAAPAVSLRLTTLVHAPCWADSADWLHPATQPSGKSTHHTTDQPAAPQPLSWTELLERLSARLGSHAVSLLTPANDHRPERMQQGQPAQKGLSGQHGQPGQTAKARLAAGPPNGAAALLPTWLLNPPLPLRLSGHSPCYQGELQLLAGPQRLEATHWPVVDVSAAQPPVTQRDYFVARSPRAGLLWVYRLHLGAAEGAADGGAPAHPPALWFLHGVFA